MAFKTLTVQGSSIGVLPESPEDVQTDVVKVLSGTTPSITPGVLTWALTGNSAPVDALGTGQSCTLMIDDGSAYSITWPSMTWFGSVPVLKTTGYTLIVLWKVGNVLYGRSA